MSECLFLPLSLRFLLFLRNNRFQCDAQTVCVGVCNDVWVNATFSDRLAPFITVMSQVDFFDFFTLFLLFESFVLKDVLYYQHIVVF